MEPDGEGGILHLISPDLAWIAPGPKTTSWRPLAKAKLVDSGTVWMIPSWLMTHLVPRVVEAAPRPEDHMEPAWSWEWADKSLAMKITNVKHWNWWRSLSGITWDASTWIYPGHLSHQNNNFCDYSEWHSQQRKTVVTTCLFPCSKQWHWPLSATFGE